MNPTVDDYRLRFETSHRDGQTISRLLRSSDVKPIEIRQVRQAAPYGTWMIYARLPRRLEDHFGINRPCLIYCPPTDDLQPRDVERTQALIRGATENLEPDIAILISRDQDSRTKVLDWAIERQLGITIIPTAASHIEEGLDGEHDDQVFRKLIDEWISSHNLYDERDPVTGDRFYGRAGLLRDLERKLVQKRGHAGLFGLRRIGKTSVLLELKDRLARRPELLSVFIDLESAIDVRHATQRIAEEIASAIVDQTSSTFPQVRQAMGLPDDWTAAPAGELIARTTDALRNVLTRGVLRDKQLVLMLDELESIVPNTDAPLEHSVQLFKSLRGLSQETRQVTLVLAGVNADPTEAPHLGGEDNPLFGLISVEYLGPLEQAECEEMIRRVGRRMSVKWDGRAVSLLTEYVGAHPLLARLAASDLVETFHERPLRPNLQQAEKVLDEFHTRQSRIFEQMTSSLRRYYPEEWEVLRVLASGDQQLATELLDDDPTILNHLAGYGVVDRQTISIRNLAFRKWLRAND